MCVLPSVKMNDSSIPVVEIPVVEMELVVSGDLDTKLVGRKREANCRNVSWRKQSGHHTATLPIDMCPSQPSGRER